MTTAAAPPHRLLLQQSASSPNLPSDKGMNYPRPVSAVSAASAASLPTATSTSTLYSPPLPRRTPLSSSPSTVPVFVPGYPPEEWSLLRGSIVGVQSSPAETTVTIFCADTVVNACTLDDALPFVFAEGPSTLHYAESLPGTWTVNLACQLQNTTAATCTGYSWNVELPGTTTTQTAWTSTFTGSAVQWAVLTLAEAPSPTDSNDDDGKGATATNDGAVVATSDMMYTTAKSAASPPRRCCSVRLATTWAVMMAVLFTMI